jgi:hypothetical protein
MNAMTPLFDWRLTPKVEGNVAYVLLAGGQTAVIDAEDAHLVAGIKWRPMPSRRVVYVRAHVPAPGGGWRSVSMHRFLLGEPKLGVIDHIDGDGLNNRKSNLRICSNAENSRNQRKPKNNTSGAKGVSRIRGRWQARIKLDGKSIFLGIFNTVEDAAAAYAHASRDVHGDFGRVE